MLIHIRPRFYGPFRNVAIIDLKVDPLGLNLSGDDLQVGRPYPNKEYRVACRKLPTRKALDGILIEAPGFAESFAYTARWAVEASLVVTHRVDYTVMDEEFDAVSDSMVLWYACPAEFGRWRDRRPDWCRNHATPPLEAEPVVEIEPLIAKGVRSREDLVDRVTGCIVLRHESFSIPTIERERVLGSGWKERMPPLESAFRL